MQYSATEPITNSGNVLVGLDNLSDPAFPILLLDPYVIEEPEAVIHRTKSLDVRQI
ncbi:hypothetical protein D3C83_310180 [compost metagenome]